LSSAVAPPRARTFIGLRSSFDGRPPRPTTLLEYRLVDIPKHRQLDAGAAIRCRISSGRDEALVPVDRIEHQTYSARCAPRHALRRTRRGSARACRAACASPSASRSAMVTGLIALVVDRDGGAEISGRDRPASVARLWCQSDQLRAGTDRPGERLMASGGGLSSSS